ncbi:IclR family transcriptional regulator C-terminal domain-containing protein [Microbispora sp. NPDC088329]|uniref:IclR family transcriptional regulator n=1 Tax=Microbispora sp. NPDC088329 TaxID=3154869 RepID=UPI0034420B03
MVDAGAARGASGAVEKSYLILGALPAQGWIGAAEVARRTGLPRSTVHRILGLLADLRLADRHLNGYRLGERMRDLAVQASGIRPSALRDRLLPYLLDLYRVTNHAVLLGVPGDGGVLCLERLHGHHGVHLPITVGSVTPPGSTAMGRVLLAFADGSLMAGPDGLRQDLGRVRRTGIAVEVGGCRPGVTSLAVPVWGPGRRVAAAISVAGPAGGLDVSAVSGVLRRVGHAASQAVARWPEARAAG